MPQGLLITLEGPDGAGKSTLAASLEDRLTAAGHQVVRTREPGGAPGAEEIRRLLVEGEAGRWSPETEILLFTAARRDHAEKVIEPAIQQGRIVVSDRYVDSTRAYQGVDDPGRRRLIDRLHETFVGREADLTIILDIHPELGLDRTGARAHAETRFESRGFGFQERLRESYRKIAEAEPRRCVMIDATRGAEEVADRAWAAIEPRLPRLPAADG